jgi:hypothetical protein
LFQNWIPQNRIGSYTAGAPLTTYVVGALSHPTASTGSDPSTNALLTILLKQGNVTDDFYTVEYRQQDGWDKAIPTSTVLIHEYKIGAYTKGQSPAYSYLQKPFDAGQPCFFVPTQCEMLVGQTWTNPSRNFQVTVTSP